MNFETCKKCLGGEIDISASFNKFTGHIILFFKEKKNNKTCCFCNTDCEQSTKIYNELLKEFDPLLVWDIRYFEISEEKFNKIQKEICVIDKPNHMNNWFRCPYWLEHQIYDWNNEK